MKNTLTHQIRTKLNQAGFTLIELLVVIGILAVLLAIVLIAINPARQFSQANDTQRRSDVNAILNAIHQYSVDNAGQAPPEIGTTEEEISSTEANICADLVDTYIAALPVDPTVQSGPVELAGCGAAYASGYTVMRSAANNRITVSAVGELTASISATR